MIAKESSFPREERLVFYSYISLRRNNDDVEKNAVFPAWLNGCLLVGLLHLNVVLLSVAPCATFH